MRRASTLVAALLAVALVGCERGPATGPEEVAWDRDTCARCQMAISDRFHAAQARIEGERNALAFDDLGCALLWLEESGVEASELWVRTEDGADWTEGTDARYAAGRNTPMGYGFAPSASGIPLDEVRARVRAKEHERRSDRHEGHAGH